MTIMKNILSKGGLGVLAISAAMMLSAGDAAKAAVIRMDTSVGDAATGNVDGPFNVSSGDVFRFLNDDLDATDSSGADYGFEFTADSVPTGVNTSITLNQEGEFTDFVAVWSTNDTIDAGDTALVVTSSGSLGNVDQNFVFTDVPRWLLISYCAVSTGGSLGLRVSAVPLPAGGLLLLTGLGGLVAARRRRKAA